MTRIVADTTSGLTPEECRRLGIPLIPQIINFGTDSYREGVDIDHAGFMARLLSGKDAPKTAAPYPSDFIEAFKQCSQGGESVVCVLPTADLSGTVRSAEIAKADFQDADIRIVDTRTIAGPLGALVLEADKAAKAGGSADEVEARVRALMPLTRCYFLVDTLEYLRRGGRIGGAAALVGTALQIKPILMINDGRIEPLEKQRTKSRALARLKELVLAEAARGAEAHLTVMHASLPREAAQLAAELKAELKTEDVIVMDLVPAIVTHAGPGALACGFFVPA
jgi:DegV family protein with EDD domain